MLAAKEAEEALERIYIWEGDAFAAAVLRFMLRLFDRDAVCGIRRCN